MDDGDHLSLDESPVHLPIKKVDMKKIKLKLK